jgi:hypothetical protein
MSLRLAIIAGLTLGCAAQGFVPQAEAQTNRLAAVAEAMGATNLNSIEYKGSGLVFSFGQAYEPGERWPRFIQRVYDASVNYQTPAMRLVQVRSQGEHPPRGGAPRRSPPISARCRW